MSQLRKQKEIARMVFVCIAASVLLAIVPDCANSQTEQSTTKQWTLVEIRQLLQSALSESKQVTDSDQRDSLVRWIGKLQLSANDAQSSKSTTNLIKRPFSSLYLLVDTAKSLAAAGDRDGAVRLLRSAGQIASPSFTEYPGDQRLTSLIIEQAELGDVQGAILSESLATQDFTTENAAIAISAAQVRAGDVAAAIRTAKAASNPYTTVQVFVRGVSSAQIDKGDLSGARTTLEMAIIASEPVNVNAKAHCLIQIAEEQHRAGDRKGSTQTFIKAAQAAKSSPYDTTALVSIVDSKINLKEYADAIEAAQHVGDPRTRSDLLRKVVLAHIGDGNLSNAQFVAEQISDDYFRSDSLASVATSYALKGNYSSAESTAVLISRPYQKAGALGDIARILTKTGNVEGAKRLIDDIPDPYYKTRIPLAVAEAQVDLQDYAGAIATLDEVMELADKIEDSHRRQEIQSSIVHDLISCHRVKTAAVVANLITDEQYPFQITRELAEAEAGIGDVSGVKHASKRVAAYFRGVDNEMQGDLASAQAEASRISDAIGTARRIEDSKSSDGEIVQIARIQLKHGDVSGARKTALNIKDDLRIAIAMSEIGAAELKAGDKVTGIADMKYSTLRLSSLKDPGAWEIVPIACVMARAGDYADAAHLVCLQLRPDPGHRMPQELLESLWYTRDIDAALQTAALLERPYDRASVIAELAGLLLQAKAKH